MTGILIVMDSFQTAGNEKINAAVATRFWEHLIRDDEDYQRNFDYIHYSPVKNGFLRRAIDWPYSLSHLWVRRNVYPEHLSTVLDLD